MKKMIIILVVATLCLSSLMAYEKIWGRYDLIDVGNDVTRSLAYNPVADEVYVATRLNNDPCVLVLDPETGVTLDTLNRPEGGYSGGIYPLNMVAVDDDGAIYVGNLSVPAIIATDKYKIYKYEDSDAEPQVVFRGALGGARFGDSMAAIGSGDDVCVYISGMGNDKIAKLTPSGDTLSLSKSIVLPGGGAARHGISPVSPNGNIWINGTDATTWQVHLIDDDGNIVAAVPDTIIATGSSAITHWNVGNIHALTAVNPFNTNAIRSARYSVFSDALGDSYTFDYLGWNSDSLLFAYDGTTLNNNINGSAVLAYDTTRHCMYAVMGVNSVTSVSMDPLVKVSSPRDHGYFTVQIDGLNKEWTNYDFLQQDGENKLYSTWSDQMMFIGLSGNSLYAPFQSQQLYIAFDTDPEGSAGQTSPPTSDGGITELPFTADVIVRLDSDTYPLINLEGDPASKWTGGFVYKSNGTTWSSSEISGFDINYGALAVVGDRNDSLISEIAIARTAAGIGEELGAVKFAIYLVEDGASGDILASFPIQNDEKALTHYFYLDSLGTSQLPRRVVSVDGGAGVGIDHMIPTVASLEANYPNPFNPVTSIRYHLSSPGATEIAIYDLTGKKVRSLINAYHEVGSYELDMVAGSMPSGVYFYRLIQNGHVIQTRKMLLLK
jgi:Secretion system C-terminal sorting domain